VKYFHRTHLAPDLVLARAATFFGARLSPAGEAPRARSWAGPIGRISVEAGAEGGHYTRVTVGTDQVGESEADKLAKRFLTLLHADADPTHRPVGAY
jgi:hypothetical protein